MYEHRSVKWAFHCVDFHEISQFLKSFEGRNLYRSLSESERKGKQNMANFYVRPEVKYDFDKPIFTKLTLARELLVNNTDTAFHENPTNDFVPDTTTLPHGRNGRTD